MAQERTTRRSTPAVAGGVLATTALVLVAINLRPAVLSLGPVLAEARTELGMNATVAGLLGSLPELCFAAVGIAAPRLARRWGATGVIAAGTIAVTIGLALRPLAGGTATFLALSALALAGIAVANVLLPVVVKQRFPTRVGAMTGLYSMALNAGAATAAAATVPVAGLIGAGWRGGLAAWAIPAALAVPAWLLLARRGDPAASGPAVAPARRVLRSGTAWALTVFFGLQATAAYVIMTWLPQVFRDAGVSAETAGLLLSVTSLLGVPLSFVLSAVAGRLRNQSGLAVALGAFGLAGYAGLWAAPAGAPWLWAVLLGVANSSFPLALTMIGMRGHDSATVGALSALAQCAGYLISIPGPIIVGALYQATGTWQHSLEFMAVLMVGQIVAGALAGRHRLV